MDFLIARGEGGLLLRLGGLLLRLGVLVQRRQRGLQFLVARGKGGLLLRRGILLECRQLGLHVLVAVIDRFLHPGIGARAMVFDRRQQLLVFPLPVVQHRQLPAHLADCVARLQLTRLELIAERDQLVGACAQLPAQVSFGLAAHLDGQVMRVSNEAFGLGGVLVVKCVAALPQFPQDPQRGFLAGADPRGFHVMLFNFVEGIADGCKFLVEFGLCLDGAALDGIGQALERTGELAQLAAPILLEASLFIKPVLREVEGLHGLRSLVVDKGFAPFFERLENRAKRRGGCSDEVRGASGKGSGLRAGSGRLALGLGLAAWFGSTGGEQGPTEGEGERKGPGEVSGGVSQATGTGAATVLHHQPPCELWLVKKIGFGRLKTPFIRYRED